MIVDFLHDEFGHAKVHAVLTSRETTFAAAMSRELGVSQQEFSARWSAWRSKNIVNK